MLRWLLLIRAPWVKFSEFIYNLSERWIFNAVEFEIYYETGWAQLSQLLFSKRNRTFCYTRNNIASGSGLGLNVSGSGCVGPSKVQGSGWIWVSKFFFWAESPSEVWDKIIAREAHCWYQKWGNWFLKSNFVLIHNPISHSYRRKILILQSDCRDFTLSHSLWLFVYHWFAGSIYLGQLINGSGIFWV